MHKIILVSVLALSLIAPNFVHAATIGEIESQIAEYQEKIKRLQIELDVLKQLQVASTTTATTKTPISTDAFCQLERVLAQGSRGNDVVSLQDFLRKNNYFSGESTGVFGPATEASLRQWQKDQAIVSSGSAGTTGWGSVGPKTRAALKVKLCGPSAETLKECSRVKEFMCGQPPMPVCPVGMSCAQVMPAPTTYGSECALELDKATLLYKGQCKGTTSTTTPSTTPPSSSGNSGSGSSGTVTVTPSPTPTPVPTPPKVTPPSSGGVSDMCKTWTDGCNTCTRLAFGSAAAACTLKACANVSDGGDAIPKPTTYQCLQTF